MPSTALTTTSTMDSLVGALRSHTLGRALPEPAVLSFSPNSPEPISVQAGGGLDRIRHLSDLLLWAYTLTEVTARWWRTPEDRLHITVTGRTTSGVRINVYAGTPFDQIHGLVQLDPDQSEGVTLDELHTLVGLLRDTQELRKGAA